jgi:HD-like signal output (HDOD) protein
VGVGICSRLIAMRVGLQEFEDAFLAGLLHDIGIVLEDQYAHKGFTQVIHSLDSYDTLGQAERDILGFDHMLLARDVARQWKFPEVVVDAILYHHDSSRCQAEHALVVNCVEVGNLLCTLKGIASVGVHKVGFPAPAIAALNLDKDDVLVLAQDFEKEMADNRDLLKI